MPRQPYPYEHAPRLPLEGSIDARTLTRTAGPLEIEIGPGRGTFMLERAQECPDTQLVGLEIRWKWATLVDERLQKLGHGEHARVFAEDARLALPRIIPDACVQAFFIHFPDPWWKKRQQKRLVVGSPFVGQMVRLLAPQGMLFVQTDVLERAEAYQALLSGHDGLLADGDNAGDPRLSQRPWSARSNREKRAEEADLPVYRLRYRKR